MLVANAFMLGAFGNSAGLLLFACSVALKTLCSSIVFSVALTSRAGGVVINSRILGHNESPFLELCYTLLLAPQCQVHKRQFHPRIPATAACRASFGALVSERADARPAPPVPAFFLSTLPRCLSASPSPPAAQHFCYRTMFTLLLKQIPE